MTLQEFLSLIADEEARIELAIDDPTKEYYFYDYFWLSYFRESEDITKHYENYEVVNFSFMPSVRDCDIKINLKKL